MNKSKTIKELFVEYMNKASPTTPEEVYDETMKFFGEFTDGGKYSKVKSDEIAQMTAVIKGLDESLQAAWKDAKEVQAKLSGFECRLSHVEDGRKELQDDLNQVVGALNTMKRAEAQIKTIVCKHPQLE
jgi:septal ring factor EnvC (AmiA/AmiB activator)